MRIIHINDSYSPEGGAQQYILNVARELEIRGHQNIVLYQLQEATTIRDGAFPAYHIRESNPASWDDLTRVMELHDPEVAFIHQVSSPSLVRAIAELLPSVAYVHSFSAICPAQTKFFRRGNEICHLPFSWKCIPYHYLRQCSAARHPRTLYQLISSTASLRSAYAETSKLVVATPYMQDELIANGFDRRQVAVLAPHLLHDGIQIAFHPPPSYDTILFAGRLEIEKGIPYLLQAMQMMRSDIRLLVAGDGTLRPLYEQMAIDFGINKRVEFIGWCSQSQLDILYDKASLVVMPSIWPEPFGKVGIEALYHGRPVVAHEVGGIPYWLKDGVCGYLVRQRDVHDLAHKIELLLESPTLLHQMGQKGQTLVTEQFKASDHIEKLLGYFEESKIEHEQRKRLAYL